MNNSVNIKIGTIERAKKLVKNLSVFREDIDAIQGHYVCDAKSILGIFSLNFLEEIEVKIHSIDEEIVNRFMECLDEFTDGR